MRSTTLVVLLAVSVLVSIPVSSSDDSDADDWNPEETWYCYGDVMLLKYPYDSTGLTIEWVITGFINGVSSGEEHHVGETVAANVGDYDVVHVVQTVTDGIDHDSKSIEVIPLGLMSSDKIIVRFMDGSHEIAREVLDGSKSVMLGMKFVDVSEDPSKTNYRFTGWYSDQECTKEFNPFIPILNDTTVYAGWTSAGSSGSITVSGYLVTFNAAPGLTYQVVGTGDRAVSFTVSVMDGYRFDMDSIQASVGTTKISPVNGVYTLSGISKDTVIEITGDRLYSVSYDTRNVSVSSEDLGRDHLSVSFSPAFGWSGVSLKVIMGGADVTSQYADGSSVDIDVLTGDVIIMAQADFPWIYVLIIVLVVVIALVAIILVKRRKAD